MIYSEDFKSFIKACKSQWICGGDRYALEKDKEFTDLVCEIAGNIWIGGNIIKYSGEIWNSKRHGEKVIEVNFFKIAVYAYIWWLKEEKHPTTGIELKKRYWDEFVEGVWNLHCGLWETEVTKDLFIEHIGFLAHIDNLVKNDGYEATKESRWDILFTVAARAYHWWLQEHGNFTSEDKGEEFKK